MREPRPNQSRRVAGVEALGLLIIVVLILAYTLLRYGGSIAWGAR